jgi:2-furoyl-CoA dehydrogenase FAD binding subunit
VKPAAFSYASPDGVEEALHVLAETGTDARVLAGGQTLGPMLNMRIVTPALIIDINRIKDFPRSTAERTSALYRQGAVLSDVALADAVPLLAKVMPYVGHYQTRSRGTVCGSVAHADPTAELPLALVTLGGSVLLASRKKTRKVAAKDFFLGPLTTDRRPDELLLQVEWPSAAIGQRFAFRELGAHKSHSAISACAVSSMLDDEGIIRSLSIGVTAIADRPLLVDTWPYLNVNPTASWIDDIVSNARRSLPFVSDMHASAEYRRHLTGVLIGRCLADILKEPAPAATKS